MEDWIAYIITIGVIVGVIVGGIGVLGFYKLEPNYATVEISRVTGHVGKSIIHVENGGIENIHHVWILFTRIEKFDTKIHTVQIDCFGEQREGSMDLFHKQGLDYEQWPNNIIVGYRLKAENLQKYYITAVIPDSWADNDRTPILETLIRAQVFTLLTKENLDKETLETALSNSLGGDFAEITSVDFTRKITE